MSDEERVVSWLEENYKGLILGIIIGLSILYGYKAYISNENTKLPLGSNTEVTSKFGTIS